MHELSLCKNILEIVKDHVIGRKGARVKKIYLDVGQLSCVDHHALRFGFSVVAKGTVAEQAELAIKEIEGRAVCDGCQSTMLIKNYYDSCINCGSFSLTVIQGEELQVKSMEIE